MKKYVFVQYDIHLPNGLLKSINVDKTGRLGLDAVTCLKIKAFFIKKIKGIIKKIKEMVKMIKNKI